MKIAGECYTDACIMFFKIFIFLMSLLVSGLDGSMAVTKGTKWSQRMVSACHNVRKLTCGESSATAWRCVWTCVCRPTPSIQVYRARIQGEALLTVRQSDRNREMLKLKIRIGFIWTKMVPGTPCAQTLYNNAWTNHNACHGELSETPLHTTVVPCVRVRMKEVDTKDWHRG